MAGILSPKRLHTELFVFLNTLQHREIGMTMWQWFTVQGFSRWQWVNRKVHRSSSVTRTINISPRSGFSLRRLEAMMWCSVASPLPANKGKQSCSGSLLSIFWDYVSRELLYNYWRLWSFKLSSAVFTPKAVYQCSPIWQQHTHNRSVSILISLAQFDRSLNLAAS